MARERLSTHQGKTVSAQIGPIGEAVTLMRVTAAGEMEMVGERAMNQNGGDGRTGRNGQSASSARPDVAFAIPLKLIPRLLRGDDSAFSEISFNGDSEFAATLSTIGRNIEWDVEEDLSKLVGDIAAHRIVGTVKSLGTWQQDATTRLNENMVEYLAEEKRAFITHQALESLALTNETLRDDVARLEARIEAKIKARINAKLNTLSDSA